jgi:hypothetical protein
MFYNAKIIFIMLVLYKLQCNANIYFIIIILENIMFYNAKKRQVKVKAVSTIFRLHIKCKLQDNQKVWIHTNYVLHYVKHNKTLCFIMLNLNAKHYVL